MTRLLDTPHAAKLHGTSVRTFLRHVVELKVAPIAIRAKHFYRREDVERMKPGAAPVVRKRFCQHCGKTIPRGTRSAGEYAKRKYCSHLCSGIAVATYRLPMYSHLKRPK